MHKCFSGCNIHKEQEQRTNEKSKKNTNVFLYPRYAGAKRVVRERDLQSCCRNMEDGRLTQTTKVVIKLSKSK